MLLTLVALVGAAVALWTMWAAAGGALSVYVSNADSGDISHFHLDAASGELRDQGPVAAGDKAAALAISPDRRYLHVSLRGQPYSIASFARDVRTGGLDMLSVVPAPDTMTHLAVDATGRFLLGASYAGNSICVLPIGRGGFLQAEPVYLARPGRNAHCILPDPSNRFVYASALGSDQMCQYVFDERTGMLTPNRPAVVPSGHVAGPRHFCFSPDSRFVFVLTELSGEVICYAMDAGSGTLAEKQRLSILPPGSTLPPSSYTPPTNAQALGTGPRIWAADIRLTPDGRFLYVSERSTSVLTIFAVDPPSGTLAYVGCAETEEQPRGINICPRGRYLIAAGEKSDHVSVYAIDRAKGGLTPIDRQPVGKAPNWVEIVELD